MQPSAASTNSASGPKPELLDIRSIPAPENVMNVLNRASALSPGASLQIRADANPWQLYDLLQQRGFFLSMTREDDGSYLGTITPREIDKLKL